MAKLLRSILEIHRKYLGAGIVDIDIIDVNKAVWIRMLYWIDAHVTAVQLLFQRIFQSTNIVDIDDIEVH
jgi:hypothetical protein